MKTIAILVITLLIGAGLWGIWLVETKRASPGQMSYKDICRSDEFLCASLKNISSDSFDNKIQSASIDSFDGANNVIRAWEQDSAGNYRYTAATNGIQTDEIVEVDGIHYTKDFDTGTWSASQAVSEKSDKRARVVDQLSLDEVLGQFYAGSGKLPGYIFRYMGESDCDGIPCRKYIAAFGNGEPVYRLEYLYFAQRTRLLVRYDEQAPEYQAVHRYVYTPNPAVTPPAR